MTRAAKDRAARCSNRARRAVLAFCDALASFHVTPDAARVQAQARLGALSRTERDVYLRLLNRWAQAWNAWARLAGDPRRCPPWDGRTIEVFVSTVRPVLPMPSAGPITPPKDAPRSRTYSDPVSGLVTEITLPDGRKRYAMYDTEVYVKPSEDKFGRPPWRR